mmetsp:Transcript_31270/g.72757  ORF Transcript_31270/g.72757 Transcript_31270/m.72757 type:complete len:228 (+) Transcript_31270:2449-3132(+)
MGDQLPPPRRLRAGARHAARARRRARAACGGAAVGRALPHSHCLSLGRARGASRLLQAQGAHCARGALLSGVRLRAGQGLRRAARAAAGRGRGRGGRHVLTAAAAAAATAQAYGLAAIRHAARPIAARSAKQAADYLLSAPAAAARAAALLLAARPAGGSRAGGGRPRARSVAGGFRVLAQLLRHRAVAQGVLAQLLRHRAVAQGRHGVGPHLGARWQADEVFGRLK